MESRHDTIFAVSSGAGKAGIAVVRLSGPGSAAALGALTGGLPEARRASLRPIRDRNGETLDRGIVLWLPGPGTFSGEDMAELQVHGSRAVLAGLVGTLAGLSGLRPAEAGEFARRAFANGRLGLTEVEGLADLIDAETSVQRRQALRQMEGRAGAVYEDWRRRLIGAIALCEAGIDFSDEDDVPAEIAGQIVPVIGHLAAEMRAALSDSGSGEAIREGLSVVIAGAPNAGKSSLMNALARRDVAIVSATPGTTRDAIEIRLDIGGMPVTVIDTAGIRESGDAIEIEGVRRALRRAGEADLVLWMSETGAGPDESGPKEPGPEEPGPGEPGSEAGEVWRLHSKIDLVEGGSSGRIGERRFAVSATTGAGLDALLGGLGDWIADRIGTGTEPVITRARHRRQLEAAVEALGRAGMLDAVVSADLVAEELRAAANALGRITGRIDVEDVLDRIFGQFCIGK